MKMSSIKGIRDPIIMIGSLGIALILAITLVHANDSYDSDSDSEPTPIGEMELGKLVRNSARIQSNQYRPSQAAASRNLYNRQQPLQLAPSYNKRSNSEDFSSLGGSPFGASNRRGYNAESSSADDDDDREPANFGSGANFDADGSNSAGAGDDDGDGPALNLNQAASGHSNRHGNYNEDAGLGAGFGFGSGGFGPTGEGADGLGDFGNDGRRAKAASSLSGSTNFGAGDDERAGALRYGPNSAINSGDRDPDDEGRSSAHSSDGQGDNDNDDE